MKQKDGKLPWGEVVVRLARQFSPVKAKSKTEPMEQRANSPFRGRVLATNTAHVPGTVLFAQTIAHRRGLAFSSGRINRLFCDNGNPLGNDENSGTNRKEIARQWEERFGHTKGGLMDHHCFIRRAIELAKPDGGRICQLVPEGLLTRDNRGMPALRLALAHACELRLIITLPRAFKDNNARMAIVYLVRSSLPAANRKTVLAEVREKWWDADGNERTTDLFGELETVVADHLDV